MLARGCVADAQMNQNFARSSVNLKTYKIIFDSRYLGMSTSVCKCFIKAIF